MRWTHVASDILEFSARITFIFINNNLKNVVCVVLLILIIQNIKKSRPHKFTKLRKISLNCKSKSVDKSSTKILSELRFKIICLVIILETVIFALYLSINERRTGTWCAQGPSCSFSFAKSIEYKMIIFVFFSPERLFSKTKKKHFSFSYRVKMNDQAYEVEHILSKRLKRGRVG